MFCVQRHKNVLSVVHFNFNGFFLSGQRNGGDRLVDPKQQRSKKTHSASAWFEWVVYMEQSSEAQNNIF